MAEENTNDALVLRDLVPAEPLLPSPALPWWAWVLIGVAVLGMAVAAILIARRRTAIAAPDPGRLREEAYHEACRDLESPAMESMQVAATRVSMVLRRYLSKVCGDPALYETHEEFISRHAALSSFPEELRKRTAEGFSHLARLKYGREVHGDPATLFSAARQLLDRLHQHTPA